MEIGKECLFLANAGDFLGERFLHLEHEFGSAPDGADVAGLGAGLRVLLVAESAAAPAPASTRTRWPASENARAPAGVSATRCSPTFVSLGTPTTMVSICPPRFRRASLDGGLG